MIMTIFCSTRTVWVASGFPSKTCASSIPGTISGTRWCCSQLRDPVAPLPPALHRDWPLCWNPDFSMGFACKPELWLLCKFIMNLTRRLLVAVAVICELETGLCYRPVFAAQMATLKYNFLFVFRPRYRNTSQQLKMMKLSSITVACS